MENRQDKYKKKFYEQKMYGFVQWINKKFGSKMRVMIPKNCFALPPVTGFNIPKQYMHTENHCYQENLGYWLDTQYNFFNADNEEKARALVKPVVSYIKYLNENSFNPTLSITFSFIKKKYSDNDKERYHAFVLINIYMYYLACRHLYDYNIYSGRKFTGGYIRSMFGNECCLCGEKMPKVNENNIHYSPFRVSKNYFQAHHIVPIAKDGKDELDNLLLLCPNCHIKIHLGCFDLSVRELTELSRKKRNAQKDGETVSPKPAAKTEEKKKEIKVTVKEEQKKENNAGTETDRPKKNESKKSVQNIGNINKEDLDEDYKLFLSYLEKEESSYFNDYVPEENFEEGEEEYYDEYDEEFDDDTETVYYEEYEEENTEIDDDFDISQLSGSGNKIIINKK